MKKISVLLISTLFIASCIKEEMKQDTLVESYKVNATVEEFGSETKAAVSDQGAFTWQDGDKIRVINGSESKVSSPLSVGGSKDAVFEFESSIDGYNIGFFPSDIIYDGKITLPADRVWKEDNATPVMKASLENGVFNFKHLGGVVRVQIQNVPTNARKFVFDAKEYKINGTFTVGDYLETDTALTSSEDKYTLTFEAPQPNTTMNFYVPLPVGTYENGFKISLIDVNGNVIYFKDGTTEQSVAQKQLLLMKPIVISGASGEGTTTIVAQAEDVTDAMNTSSNVKVTVVAPSEGSTASIELPKKYEGAETTHYLTIGSIDECTQTIEIVEDKTDNTGNSISALIVNVPSTEDVEKLVIDMPNTTVTIAVNDESATFEEVEATTADNTLVVKGGVTIKTLTVKKGNVIVQEGARITNVSKGEGNNQTPYVILMSGAKAPENVGEGINVVSNGEYNLIYAVANSNEFTLTEDIELTQPITIAKDKNFTLDLKDHTISGIATNASASNLFIVNTGANLTIKNGTIWFYATNPDMGWGGEGQPPYPGYANNTINNRGTLIIENAKIENKTSAGGASYVIDNYDGGSLTVNNGVIIQSGDDVAIRMFASSANNINDVTINSGTITGKRGVWIQLAGSDKEVAPNVNLNIADGTLTGSIDKSGYKLAIYSYSFGNDMKNVKFNISGGTFNGDIALTGGKNKTNIESLTITGGTFNGLFGDVYSYGTDDLAAKAIKITGGNFSHLYPLTYMADDNGAINVTLANDFKVGDADDDDMAGPILIPSGNNVTLDLNGKKISQTSDTPVSMITNYGNMTINDSGNGSGQILFTFNGTVNNGVAANAISNRGNLVVNNGYINNTGKENQIGYAIDNYNGSTLTVNGGKISASGSSYYDGIRLFCGANETKVIVNGGAISSIWAQNPSKDKASKVEGLVTFNDGEVSTIYYESYTTVKVKTGLNATVTAYGNGAASAPDPTEEDGYKVYHFEYSL